MARGRMLNKSISYDKDVAELDSRVPYGAIVFSWMISHADVEGRVHGDPAVIKGTIFPRLTRVTIEIIEEALEVADELGLLVWYWVDGDRYVAFPGFEKNQEGLRKNREAKSAIPPPPDNAPDLVRSNSGVTPATVGVGPAEVKENRRLREREHNGSTAVSGGPPPAPVFSATGEIRSTVDLEEAVASWGWQLLLGEQERQRCKRLVDAAPVSADEVAYAKTLAAEKPNRRRIPYLLGVIEGRRGDAASPQQRSRGDPTEGGRIGYSRGSKDHVDGLTTFDGRPIEDTGT